MAYEKISHRSGHHSHGKRILKKATNKKIRRSGKEYWEDGYKRIREVTRGWTT